MLFFRTSPSCRTHVRGSIGPTVGVLHVIHYSAENVGNDCDCDDQDSFQNLLAHLDSPFIRSQRD